MADPIDRRRPAGAVPVLASEVVSALLALWSLAASAARVWRATFLAMGTWFCLGHAVHTLALLASARLGAEHATLGLLAFVVGVVATLVALVMMIHSVEPHLRATRRGRPDASAVTGLRVPDQVFVRERAVDVVTSAVGPFLAVYAVWGFVEDQVREVFVTNLAVQGLGGVDNFSLTFSPQRLGFYLIVAAAAWLCRQLLTALTADRQRRPLALVGILAEALWVFCVFVVLLIVAHLLLPWARTRAAWAGLQDGWQQLLSLLPDWSLPFGLTVPQALDRAAAALVDTVIPGAWQAVALPLVWLALTATVLGWREFGGRDVLAGTRLQRRDPLAGPRTRTRTLVALLTGDLRTKYLPVLQALRLIGYAGPRFVGVYLVLATVLTAAQKAFDIGVTLLLGPRDVADTLLTDSLTVLVSGLVFTPLAISLYAAAFDEALGAVLRQRATSLSGGPRPDDGQRPETGASGPGRRSGPGSDN